MELEEWIGGMEKIFIIEVLKENIVNIRTFSLIREAGI